MRIIFLGTPDFAIKTLKKLALSRHEVVAVVTQPDRPMGRNYKTEMSAVKKAAMEIGLNVLQFDRISREGAEVLRELKPDIMVTCAYGQILSQEIIDIPHFGIINVHASLLPKYRGAAPIQWSIINGDTETGVTIMQTERGLDTGDILHVGKISITEDMTAGELFDRLSELGAELLLEALELIESGKISRVKQDSSLATTVRMLKKTDGEIDWSKTAIQIHNQVRGMNPWPCTFSKLNGSVIKIWATKALESSSATGIIGQILTADSKNGLTVLTGDGIIEILELQAENSKRMSAKDYLVGHKLQSGIIFEWQKSGEI